MSAESELMFTVCSIIKEHPLSQGLQEEAIQNLAKTAWLEGKIHDPSWLEDSLSKLQDEIVLKQKESTIAETLSYISVAPQAQIQNEEDLEFVIKKHQDWMQAVLDPKATSAHGRANFRGVNLRGYDLSGRNLSCADFTECDLSDTNLSYAVLSCCHMTKANLSGANLKGAVFKKAKMDGAILTGAILDACDFSQVEMSKVVH